MLRPSHVSSALSFFISHCNAQAPSLQFSGQPFFEPFGVPTFVEINQCVGCLSSRRRVDGVKFDFHTGPDGRCAVEEGPRRPVNAGQRENLGDPLVPERQGESHPDGAGEVPTCVEINRCVGCTRRAARNRHRHAIEEASHRWRGNAP